MEESHRVHWDPFVIAKEKNTKKRKVKEALKIKQVQKRNGAMNHDTGMKLSKLWLNLIM